MQIITELEIGLFLNKSLLFSSNLGPIVLTHAMDPLCTLLLNGNHITASYTGRPHQLELDLSLLDASLSTEMLTLVTFIGQ
jgi:hypothetical protein